MGARQNSILSRGGGRKERSYWLRMGTEIDRIRAGREPWQGV